MEERRLREASRCRARCCFLDRSCNSTLQPSRAAWKPARATIHGRGGSSAYLRGKDLTGKVAFPRLLIEDPPTPQPEPFNCEVTKDCDESPAADAVFNILDFGAVGDGKTNSTPALLRAIEEAIALANGTTPVTVLIPANGTFRLWPFAIEAAKDLTLQVDGDIIGPGLPALWDPAVAFIRINDQQGFRLQGKGRIDLDGTIWGDSLENEQKPNGILLTKCNNCEIEGISIYNSPATQIVINGGSYVNVENVVVSAPDYSKEAGGVSLRDCKRCMVLDSSVRSADTHVLIGDGCDGVVVHNCDFRGDGKGVTVMGSGADVRITRITVRNSVFVGTYYGARVLSRMNDRGTISSILFRNLTMESVDVPVVINQLFGTCQPENQGRVQASFLLPLPGADGCQSPNERTGIAISNMTFTQIAATIPNSDGLNLAGVFRCSNVVPCEGLLLRSVKVSLAPRAQSAPSGLSFTCSKAYGQSVAVSPSSCLM